MITKEVSSPGQVTSKCGVLALVGRPNVGKSTLFNRLCGAKDALVHDTPGLTRDRRYGQASFEGAEFTVIDTGGLFDESDLAGRMKLQVETAIDESDVGGLVLDARVGLVGRDEDIAQWLRKRGCDVVAIVNKIDAMRDQSAMSEFSTLGFAKTLGIAAIQGRGLLELQRELTQYADSVSAEIEADWPSLAVVGRPNVGKSTLVNALLGEDRQVVSDQPGTTRDSIAVSINRKGQKYCLIDTAGVRRKGRVSETVEKFSVVQTLQSLSRSKIALLLIDAKEGIVDQDLHIVSYAEQAGCGIILVVNKWDGLKIAERVEIKKEINRRLQFAPWIPIRFASALHGTGVGDLFVDIQRVNKAGEFNVKTPELNQILDNLTHDHPPPSSNGRQIKLRYAHKVGSYPPTIMIHGNQTERLPSSYVRYLENRYRDKLDLVGLPLRIKTRSTDNPFKGKVNKLSERQYRRRKRMIQRRKKLDR